MPRWETRVNLCSFTRVCIKTHFPFHHLLCSSYTFAALSLPFSLPPPTPVTQRSSKDREQGFKRNDLLWDQNSSLLSLPQSSLYHIMSHGTFWYSHWQSERIGFALPFPETESPTGEKSEGRRKQRPHYEGKEAEKTVTL